MASDYENAMRMLEEASQKDNQMTDIQRQISLTNSYDEWEKHRTEELLNQGLYNKIQNLYNAGRNGSPLALAQNPGAAEVYSKLRGRISGDNVSGILIDEIKELFPGIYNSVVLSPSEGTINKYRSIAKKEYDENIPLIEDQRYRQYLKNYFSGDMEGYAAPEMRKSFADALRQQTNVIQQTRGVNPAVLARMALAGGATAATQANQMAEGAKLAEQQYMMDVMNKYGTDSQLAQSEIEKARRGIAASQQASNNQLLGGLIGAGGSALAMSLNSYMNRQQPVANSVYTSPSGGVWGNKSKYDFYN